MKTMIALIPSFSSHSAASFAGQCPVDSVMTKPRAIKITPDLAVERPNLHEVVLSGWRGMVGACVTGNMASNLIGQTLASGFAGAWGIGVSFCACAVPSRFGGSAGGRSGRARRGMPAIWAGSTIAAVGVGLMALNWLRGVPAGTALLATGPLLAQALATSFVSGAAMGDGAGVSWLYLACNFSGGLLGLILLGQVYALCSW